MDETLRIFGLLMYKNLIVRKRHWKVLLLIETILTILLLLWGLTVRMWMGAEPSLVDRDSYFPPLTQQEMQPSQSMFDIRYTPENLLTNIIMERVQRCMQVQQHQVIRSRNEDEMLAEIARSQENEPYTTNIGVIFSNMENMTLTKNFKYKVRVSNKLPQDLYARKMSALDTAYLFSDFDSLLVLQICLDEAYIELTVPKLAKKVEMSIEEMPYPPYIETSQHTQVTAQVFAEITRFAFLVVMCIEVTFSMNEKFIGINILMSVNGVKNRQNLFSWLISGVLFSITYLLPIAVVFKFHHIDEKDPLFKYGDTFLLWIVLTVHVCHVIAFGMHITAYFWRPSRGIFATFLFAILLDVLNNFATGSRFRHISIYLGILSPNFLLSSIFDEVFVYEAKGIGIQWTNIFHVADPEKPGENCIAALLVFSLLGIALNFFMTVYVNAVRPGKYGVAQNPLFCLQMGGKGSEDAMNVSNIDYSVGNQKEFEKVPEGSLEPGIQIRNLKKSYSRDCFGRTTVQALKGINVDFYKGQITALLGHNGAGKTTMMSILAGLTGSNDGTVIVNGKNIKNELNAVRTNLGLCPQENMFFPDFNVYEQILFFGMLKAKDKSRKQLEEEVNVLLAKMNLTDKKNTMPKKLSGGQKRRMCLAMAVIGDASVLILDEPTSGMDAESKREVWDIILKLRGEKTILISTHDMEEADILGDRVAIIHSGRMRSYGTTMFLKKLYGEGQVEVTLSTEPSCDPRRIVAEIGLNAQLLSQDDGKAVLAIPVADNLPEALDKLEAQKRKFGVTGLSVSVITLEQIFLRVTREEGDESDSIGEAAKTFVKVAGFSYLMQTCFAHIVKKFAFSRKNPWTFVISMLLPCLAATSMLAGHDVSVASSDVRGPISISLDAYSHTHSFFYADEPVYGKTYERCAKSFGGTAEHVKPNVTVADALLEVAKDDLRSYFHKYIVAGEFTTKDDVLRAKAYYSGTAHLSIPASINMLSNSIVKAATGDDGYKILMSVQELPKSSPGRVYRSGDDVLFLTIGLVVFLTPAMALYVTQPLHENLSGLKQLQLMTGASSFTYWISMYLFDLLQYIISVVLLISMFVVADVSVGTNYYRGTEIMIFFLVLFMFGASILPLVYMFSFWKWSMNATINVLSIVPLIMCPVDLVFLAMEAASFGAVYEAFRVVQSKVFLLWPHISIMYGHVSFVDVMVQNGRCRSMSRKQREETCSGYGDECCALNCRDGSCESHLPYFVEGKFVMSLGSSLLWMTGSFFLFFIIICILEQKWLIQLWARLRRNSMKGNTSDMDDLVKKEEDVVSKEVATWLLKDHNTQNLGTENIFLAHNISKRYGKLKVVKGISFRVKQGECFGLLGVNGAGKSTTFRMLTGAEIPHSGSMVLKEYSLGNDPTKYLAEMGYCPQQDAIIDTLNAYDHLYLFARLRGIPRDEVKTAVEKWIQKLNLKRCAAQPSGTYSGGNKRRLNIALALIGNPSLVLMDEPTTGVDPAARRSLWNTLKTCQQSGQSIILTSHSMEECEALCNRLAIMVKGQLVCIGASQELKQRFGAGYNIHVKLHTGCDKMDVDKIKRRIQSTLVCKLSDENTGFIGYHVTDPEVTWTIMYTMMTELKNDYPCIEDFAVLSSTLEQLFIQFARAPDDSDASEARDERKKSCWARKRNHGSPV